MSLYLFMLFVNVKRVTMIACVQNKTFLTMSQWDIIEPEISVLYKKYLYSTILTLKSDKFVCGGASYLENFTLGVEILNFKNVFYYVIP